MNKYMKNPGYTSNWDGDGLSSGDTKDNLFCQNSREWFLSDDIDNANVGALCSEFLEINRQDAEEEAKFTSFERKPIKLYINSFGGSVYDMWALIDVIGNSKTPVYTYCFGYAMSAAFQIFLAGHKRFCTKHATFMYHQMHCNRAGKYQDMVEDREQMDLLNNKVEEFVQERTKITSEKIREIRQKKIDYYVNATEALEIGIVDKVLEVV